MSNLLYSYYIIADQDIAKKARREEITLESPICKLIGIKDDVGNELMETLKKVKNTEVCLCIHLRFMGGIETTIKALNALKGKREIPFPKKVLLYSRQFTRLPSIPKDPAIPKECIFSSQSRKLVNEFEKMIFGEKSLGEIPSIIDKTCSENNFN